MSPAAFRAAPSESAHGRVPVARAPLRVAGVHYTSLYESARAPLRVAGVLAGVEQDVTQGEPHFSRRLEGAGVIAVDKEATLALEVPIDGKREANREALDTAGERPALVRLRDEVQVIPLHAEVDEREAELLLACGQSLAHEHEQGVLAQRGHVALYAQGDVEGVMA